MTAMGGASALAPEDLAHGRRHSRRLPRRRLITGSCLLCRMLRVGSEVATQKKAHPPTDYLAQAGAELATAGILTDPPSFIAEARAHLGKENHKEVNADV